MWCVNLFDFKLQMFSKYYLFLKEKNCICCQFRQHNPTHYAQDKTTQQIMHNTTHCAPADSILYTVNISTTARKEKKKAKRKTEHQEEDHL